MKYNFIYVVMVTLSLSNCSLHNTKNKEITEYTSYPPLFSEKSIWTGNIIKECKNDNAIDYCIIDSIKKSGGSIEALQAAKYLAKYWEPGYVISYQKVNSVNIIEVEYPMRANTNTGTLIVVPSTGEVINVDDIPNSIYSSSVWSNFAKKNPEVLPYAAGNMKKKEITSKDIKLTFSYPLRKCHGCDDIASLNIIYKFKDEGKFIGADISKILYVSKK